MSGANNRTLNVDSLFVRNIYFKDYANNPIPANQLLVSRGDGGTYFGNLPYSTNSTFYQAINEVDAPTADGGTYRLVASTAYNTLLLEPGAGMQFYSNSQTGGLIVYNTGPEQIVAGGQSLPFSTLTDELVGGRTLFFQGKNDISVYISDTTVVFDSITNTNISSIVELQSTSIGLEQEFSTTNGYLNSSINTINVLFYSTNLYYLTSTLNAQYALVEGLSTYFLVPNQINISTVSTTNLTLNQNVIHDIPLSNSIYDPCAVYANNTLISTNTDFLTFTDQFTNVTFAIDKEYLYAKSTLYYGPSTSIVTKGQQVQLGWFPGISTQGSNTQSLRSQFVPFVQQIQVMDYIVSTNNVSTVDNYYFQNIGKFDQICAPSNLILSAKNVYTSSIYLSTINGLSVLASGSNYSDYLYWNGSNWTIGYSTIHIGDQAGGDRTQGEGAIAIGAAAGQSNQYLGTVAIGQQAGQSTQKFYAVAVGYQAGQYSQANQTVAIGFQAGQYNQNTEGSIAIGELAGASNQNGIAIGSLAGAVNQNGGIAIGTLAGEFNQSGIAIGNSAGFINQSTAAIAIGVSAGYQNQMPNTIAIGSNAGTTGQTDNSIAIGAYAGYSNQSPSSIAVGFAAGSNNQSNNSIAIGNSAGQSTQGAYSVAIGNSAGQITQGSNTVAIGNSAGKTNQGSNAVAIGYAAGSNNQSTNTIVINASGVALNSAVSSSLYISPIRNDESVTSGFLHYNSTTHEIVFNSQGGNNGGNIYGSTIYVSSITTNIASLSSLTVSSINGLLTLSAGTSYGDYLYWNGTNWVIGDTNVVIGGGAGRTNQGAQAIAIGVSAGSNNQGTQTIAIGVSAGPNNQGTQAIAIGAYAGSNNQGLTAVAVGNQAGQESQGSNAVAIGNLAGQNAQGSNAIAIGYAAGANTQNNNTTVINATGAELDTSYPNALYVAPIRNDESVKVGFLHYNAATNEIVYNAQGGSGGGGGGGSLPSTAVNRGDYLYWNGASWVTGFSTISIGDRAGGDGAQANNAVAVGGAAGNYTQRSNAVAVGFAAGYSNQGAYAVAIGTYAAQYNQGISSIAIGINAGQSNQLRSAVAIGNSAGQSNQASNAVAIGTTAAILSQGAASVAIGQQAGQSNQLGSAVAIGVQAGQSTQGIYGIAIGNTAAQFSQATNTVAIGNSAGQSNQADYAIAIGFQTGQSTQGYFAVAIGRTAAQFSQGTNCVAIGAAAGNSNQGLLSLAIGAFSGTSNQGQYAVSVGGLAGENTQGLGATAVGYAAALSSQGAYAVAIGRTAAQLSQGTNCVAIGAAAGNRNQGSNAIAIGYAAGSNNQSTNTIIINATGVELNSAVSSSLYIDPIRNDESVTSGFLHYNSTTKEIVFNAQGGGGTLIYTSTLYASSVTTATASISSLVVSSINGPGSNGNFIYNANGLLGATSNVNIVPIFQTSTVVFAQNTGSFNYLPAPANFTTNNGGVWTSSLIFANYASNFLPFPYFSAGQNTPGYYSYYTNGGQINALFSFKPFAYLDGNVNSAAAVVGFSTSLGYYTVGDYELSVGLRSTILYTPSGSFVFGQPLPDNSTWQVQRTSNSLVFQYSSITNNFSTVYTVNNINIYDTAQLYILNNNNYGTAYLGSWQVSALNQLQSFNVACAAQFSTLNATYGTVSSLTVSSIGSVSLAGDIDMKLNNIKNIGSSEYSVPPFTFSITPTSTITSGSYTYFVCNSSCTVSLAANLTNVVYYAIGGGGGGGSGYQSGGGGGAGGLQTNDPAIYSSLTLSSLQYNNNFLQLTNGQTYTITIGTGGGSATNGTNTTFISGVSTFVTATGGGAGVPDGSPGASGGCGGGGGVINNAGGTGSQGFNGGAGGPLAQSSTFPWSSGGGGGGISTLGVAGNYYNQGGPGGVGLTIISIPCGYGGRGGATDWYVQNPTTGANATTPGSGGGGSALFNAGGNGASGIFILGIPTSQLYSRRYGIVSIDTNRNLVISTPTNIVLSGISGPNNNSPFVLTYNSTSGIVNYTTLTNSNSLASASTIAYGTAAGSITQGDKAIAIGYYAGQSTQQSNAIAIGNSAGLLYQSTGAIAIGYQAGFSTQQWNAIAIGYDAGQYNQGILGLAIGNAAGQQSQGSNSVAIGNAAGQQYQGSNSVAIGWAAASTMQNRYAVAIGTSAAQSNQGTFGIAIGTNAGANYQSTQSIAIGNSAGAFNQSLRSVAIGTLAGQVNQGGYAVAIGYRAGDNYQHNSSIILNATGNSLNTLSTNSFYVSPIRNDETITSGFLHYNTMTNEIVYNAQNGSAIVNSSITQTLVPNTDNVYDIGTSTLRIRHIYVGPSSLTIGTGAIYADASGNLYTANSTGTTLYIGGTNQFSTVYTSSLTANTLNNVTFYTSSQSLTIGTSFGYTKQGANATAVGSLAGYTYQGSNAVATGIGAGYSFQGVNSVSIGAYAGNVNTISVVPGSTWSSVTSSVTASYYGISVSGNGQYQLATATSYVYSSSNYGSNWTDITSKLSGSEFQGVSVDYSGQYQTICVFAGPVYVSINYGATFTSNQGNAPWETVSISATGQYQTAISENYGADNGGIFTSVNYGSTWTSNTGVPTGVAWQALGVSGSGQYQTAAIYGQGVYTSSNYGSNWTSNVSAPVGNWNGASICSNGQYQTLVQNNGGGIFTSANYGVTWTSNTSAPFASWTRVSVSQSGQYQSAVQYPGRIFTSTDYGSTWTSNASAPSSNWNGISISADNTYQAAVVYNGKVYVNQGITGLEGNNTVAIGAYAGYSNQRNASIVINATGAILNSALPSSFYVAPVRFDSTITLYNALVYNSTTKEITYNSGKTFVIDHPKDESKYLVHACLEGPEAGVYYRGTGTIADLESSVTITLPDYVDALATEFTVQVTPIYNGGVRTLNVSRISNNQFTVYGDSGEFDWHVYGRRLVVDVEPKKSAANVRGEGPYRWIA